MSAKKTLGSGNYLNLVANDHWEWAERPPQHDAACIVATDTSGALILVEQYRYPLSSKAIELPAGLVGDEAGHEGEAILTAAARELEEETGYVSEDWRFLMRAASSAGMTSEMPALVQAKNCKKVGAGGGVDDEDIQTHILDLNDAEAWLKDRQNDGTAVDIRVYFGLAIARGHLNV